jgi:hypothetical protein
VRTRSAPGGEPWRRCAYFGVETVDPLKPYEPILQELAASMGLEVSYRRMPITDMSIPTTEAMAEILNMIETEIGAGRPVYFHCWGGIGRTGTVAGCWLVQQGYPCEDALQRIRELRARTSDARAESPQTTHQKAFVRSWPSKKSVSVPSPNRPWVSSESRGRGPDRSFAPAG